MAGEDINQGESLFLWKLVDFVPIPIYAKDGQGRYQCVNQYFAGMILGLPKQAILGRSLVELRGAIPLELAETYHAKDLELMKRGGVQSYESEVPCADGQRRFFEFQKTVVNKQDGTCLGIVGIMMDVSLRRSLQEKALANEKMRAAMQTAGAVSHELSQPLQVIAGTLELCALEPDIPPQLGQYLETMMNSAMHAKDILRKLQNLHSFQTTEYKHTSTSRILDLDESTKA